MNPELHHGGRSEKSIIYLAFIATAAAVMQNILGFRTIQGYRYCILFIKIQTGPVSVSLRSATFERADAQGETGEQVNWNHKVMSVRTGRSPLSEAVLLTAYTE
jgi:hypothetical protein